MQLISLYSEQTPPKKRSSACKAHKHYADEKGIGRVINYFSNAFYIAHMNAISYNRIECFLGVYHEYKGTS